MEGNNENLVFVFTLTNQFEGLDEPILLITNKSLTNTSEIGQTIAFNDNILTQLTIEKAIQLSNKAPTQIVPEKTILSQGFTLIYSENDDNKGFLTTGNISVKNGKLQFTSDLEVVNISELMKNGILAALPSNFMDKMQKLKTQLFELKNNNNVSKSKTTETETETETNDVNILFKQVINEFISLTEKILNISNFKKFISFNEKNYAEVMEKIKDDANKKGQIQRLQKYYLNQKDAIESVWKGVDFSEFKKYEGETMSEKNTDLQTVYQDLIYTNNDIINNSQKTDDDKDDFFKNNIYKGSNDDYKVILKRFTEYLYRFKNKDNMFKGDNKMQFETMNFLYTVIEKHYGKLKEFVEGNILNDINGGDDENKNELPQAINLMIRNIMKTNILTFVKIRNDQHKDRSYNQRMDIQVNQTGNPKHLLLQYNDDNLQYYKKENDIFKSNITNYDDKFVQDGNSFKVAKYDKKYLFGEFTQIFTPELTNGQIAEKMTIIKDNLLSDTPKPVFLMGYGASGAGKTSTLIYFNQENTDGILINLCNQVGSKYENMEVQYREFYDSDMCNLNKPCKDNDSGKGKTFTETPVGIAVNENAKFKFKENQYELQEEFKHTNHHEFRIKKLNEETKSGENKETTFKPGTTLGELMIYLIDTDRHVKATTNNPNSSRSHSLIFVKFTNEEKTAHLIVGDFAGVENEFDCDNPKVKEDFMNIKSDKKDKDGKEYAFYKAEFDGDILDPIGPNKINKTEKQQGGDEESDKNDDKLPMITPDNLKINFENHKETWIKDGNYEILGKFNGDSFSLFAKLFIKANGKEYDILDNAEYTNLLNSFFNYRVAVQSSYSKNTDESDVAGNDTEEIKNFKSAFKTYKEYSNNKEKLQNQKNEYEPLKAVIYKKIYELYDLQTNKANLGNAKAVYKAVNNKFDEQTYTGYKKDDVLNKTKEFLIEHFKIDKVGVIINHKNLMNTDTDQNGKQLSFTKDMTNSQNAANTAVKYILGNPPGGAGENPAENVKTTHNAIKESAKQLLTKLGIAEDFDKYLRNIEEVNDGKITYKPTNKSPTDSIIEKLKAEYVNGNFVNFMYSNVFSEKKINGSGSVEDSELKKFVDNAINSRNRRLEIGNIVCAHRRTEGYFINDSLKQIRGVIRDLLYEKNTDTLGVVPNYIDICFDKYCPTHENCFAFDNNISKPNNSGKIDSVIFQEIYKYLKGNSDYEISQMYQDILVGVFCVINISKGANNPPPVPYVDINDLKRLVYFNSAKDILGSRDSDGNLIEGDKTKEFLKLATQLINVIETKYIDKIEGQDKNKIKDIQEALSKINDKNAFHNYIVGAQNDDLKYSFKIFKIVVFHLLQKFSSSTVGGGPNVKEKIHIEKLFEIDLIRLFILRDWAKVEKEKKTNPNIYGKVKFPIKGSNKFTYTQDINSYIEQVHPYFLDMYNTLFHANILKQLKKIKSNKNRNIQRHALFENDYDTMAIKIRDEINKHEEYQLKSNVLITVYIDPSYNEKGNPSKKVKSLERPPNETIKLAIDEIKSVISDKDRVELFKNSSNDEDHVNLQQKKTEIEAEIKNPIDEEAVKAMKKLNENSEFQQKLAAQRQKIENEDEIKALQLVRAKEKIVEDGIKKGTIPFNNEDLDNLDLDNVDLEQLSTMSEQEIESLYNEDAKSVNSDKSNKTIFTQIEDDRELINDAEKLVEDVNRELGIEYDTPQSTDEYSESDNNNKDSIISFVMEGFEDKITNNLTEMISRYSSSVIQHMKEFLEIVENSNAISMVGTLEFTDKMAKLNTVATICNEGIDETLFDNFKQTFKTKPLYGQETSRGGSLKKKKTKTSKTGSKKNKKA